VFGARLISPLMEEKWSNHFVLDLGQKENLIFFKRKKKKRSSSKELFETAAVHYL